MSAQPISPRGGAEPSTAATSAAEGERSVWIQDHLDAVYRFARRRLPAPDAEDVAAEAFQALFEAAARGVTVGDPASYLFGVARRRTADRLRRHARGHEVAALPEGWEGFCDRPLPPEVAADGELAEAVHVALGLLVRADRDLLLSRYRDGLATSDLAERLGTTPKAVEMRLYRARADLRRRLAEVGSAWTVAPAGGTPGAHAGEGP
jgi:RNA polymerase sigma-70 factor (ECF subfamily)